MLTFSFKSKVANPADIRPHVRMGPDMFFQHAWLLTTYTTLLTYVFTPASTSNIYIVFIGFVPERERFISNKEMHKKHSRKLQKEHGPTDTSHTSTLIYPLHMQSAEVTSVMVNNISTDPPSKILIRVGTVWVVAASLSFHSSLAVFTLQLMSFTFFP